MADSEDEYDKKIRDKFRGERTESFRGIDRREDRRPRDDFIERDGWGARSRGRGDYRPSLREKYSPIRHEPPPIKRIRTEWDDRRYFDAAAAASNYSYGAWLSAESQAPVTRTIATVSSSTDANVDTQPPMLSLKAFLNTQDDTISDEEALKRYNDYKRDFRRQQLNEFFVAHKDEEWFKDKYHPVNSQKRKADHLASVKKRLEGFNEFYEKKRIDNIMVDADQSTKLTKLMDAFVIILEGGNEFDLTILDDNPTSTIKPFSATDNNKLENSKCSENDSSKSNGVSQLEGKENKIVTDDELNDQTVTTTQNDEEKDEKIQIDDVDEVKIDTSKEKSDGRIIETISLIKDGDSDDDDKEVIKKSDGPKPKPLHRTSSLFLRNLAPTITKEDIENVVKKFKGFLRVALADPQLDKRWSRRGWITFERDVDIKEICWNISNIRIKDNELSPIVNRDLSRRIRTVSSITTNKHVVRNDMKLCVQIINNLDKKFSLWCESSSEEEAYAVKSKNPVLQNITSYLIEEASAEEEALLGENEVVEESDETDPAVFQALDRMILYLRLTHSIDYYNHCEYPHEDEMPNRCGIIHARITSPNSKVTSDEVAEYCKSFKQKCHHLLDPSKELTDEEITDLGKKNPDAEVEKFIAANTQELGPEKWLCPLSGKKFKGPEFVLKHIQNKHAEKIDEVRLECEYFNNYLQDPKRPQLTEHPGNKVANKAPEQSSPAAVLSPAQPAPFQYGYGTAGMYAAGYGRGSNFGYTRPLRRGGGARTGLDYRPIVNYRDLDAPKEPEEFV